MFSHNKIYKITLFVLASLVVQCPLFPLHGQTDEQYLHDDKEDFSKVLGALTQQAWSHLEPKGIYEKAKDYLSDKAIEIGIRAGFVWTLNALAALGTKRLTETGSEATIVRTENTTIGKVAVFLSNPFMTELVLRTIKDAISSNSEYKNMTLKDSIKYGINIGIDVVANVLTGTGMDFVLPSIDIESLDILKEHLGWKLLNPSTLSQGFSWPLASATALSFIRQLPKASLIEFTNDLIGQAKEAFVDLFKEKYVEPTIDTIGSEK